MAVRSEVLAVGSFLIPAGGSVNLFVVPAGFRAIVRSLIIANTTAGVQTCQERYRSGGTGGGTVCRDYSIAAGSFAESPPELWRVVDEGDALALRNASSWTASVWCSGALLDLVP